ncbi:U6 snRNA-associated Sm-like protein LSm1 [Hydra vulgaris]|uniref:U6 snRNA-associated Sm-like protein LSm1 n=1 Tax=Hydra vulgaris TaxID=6087 RepID=A0ABM4B4S9_HYDVU
MEGFMHYLKTRTASLLTELDKRLLVVLRDGRTLIGELRSVDQFANVVLESTIERIHVGNKYGDISRGVFIVRGDNIVLLGEMDVLKEKSSGLKEVSVEEILEAQRVELLQKEQLEKRFNYLRHERGLAPFMPDMGLDDYA